MERQRREEELKGGRSSKKGQDAEQSILNRASSPQTGGSMKSMKEEKKEKEKDKSGQSEKEGQEGSGLKTAGPEGEITAGFLLKKSTKTNGWSRRWFVLNEKTGKMLNYEHLRWLGALKHHTDVMFWKHGKVSGSQVLWKDTNNVVVLLNQIV
ncbi:hypothetical protein V8G54_022474 [Vigna mungo]|uniref:PH domain-containing protein n=1 Tax=Vigna mungo TaxID=3915 RepID=A0AAQ3RQP9_VIGMU